MFSQNCRIAGKCLSKYIVGIIICFFAFLSLAFIFNAATTKNIGYQVSGTKDGQTVHLFDYDISDESAAEKIEQYRTDGYTVSQYPVRSELTPQNKFTYLLIAQIISLITEIMIVFSVIWDYGVKDHDSFTSGKSKKDAFRGVKIGLIAAIPAAILYIVLLLCKFGVFRPQFLSIYRTLNSQFYGIVDWIYGSALLATDLSFVQLFLLALLLLFLPVCCGISYYIGLRNINIIDRTVYKRGK